MTDWVTDSSTLSVLPSIEIQRWLTKPYILSQALKKVCRPFQVSVLSQTWGAYIGNEAESLKQPSHEKAYIREVFLQNGSTPVCYARTVVPKTTFDALKEDLETLGQKPIGETLLYNHPESVRDPFKFAYLDDKSLLDNIRYYYPNYSEDYVFARRSVFHLSGRPLMVMECFLPDIPDFPVE